MAKFTKAHFIELADAFSRSMQSAGRDINAPYSSMTVEQKSAAFDYLASRLIDLFKAENDLFSESKFKERALLE